jgi:hypothetical protein
MPSVRAALGMRRGLLFAGIVGLVALAAGLAALLPSAARAPDLSAKEAGAAFLGLIVLVVAVLGPDMRDWL